MLATRQVGQLNHGTVTRPDAFPINAHCDCVSLLQTRLERQTHGNVAVVGSDAFFLRRAGDSDYSRLSLAEVEKRLDKLKQEHGEDLYVKIIIPKDSGLSYSEAWQFMRNLLVKYDYYYQE